MSKTRPRKTGWVQATSPDGKVFITWHVGKFCKKMGLDHGNVSHALTGSSRYGSVKGWKFRRMSQEEINSYDL